MAGRLKEDEKHERIIRGLLKLPPNRKCINCNTLGPQYVCTNFSTFVCTTCAGIHREFTHRIKSISMAKFTPQEVASLQEGGNERAREIYFKEWDPQRQSAPDSSNVDRLRDFIKHVYVAKRYAGEGSTGGSPQVKLGDKIELNENRRSDGYQSGSRSPSYDGTYERRYSAGSSPSYEVRRSPGYDQGGPRHSDHSRSPAHSGVVNDWRREDRFATARKSEDCRSSDGEFKSEIRSPDNQKDSNVPSPPVVRPVRDILGENVVPLRIGEPPKAGSSRAVDGSTLSQRTASSSSLASANGNPTELRRETSLIDFDAEPEPAAPVEATQAPQSSSSATQSTSAPPSDDNWACFDNVPQNKVSEAPPPSSSSPSDVAPRPTAPSNGMFPSSSSAGDFLFASLSGSTETSVQQVPANGGTGQGSCVVQHHQQQFPQGTGASGAQFGTFPGGSSSQGLMGYPAGQTGQTGPAPAGNPMGQTGQTVPAPASQAPEVQSSGRKELPADIFTAMYPSYPYQAPGWQARPAPGMGYMYHPSMLVQPMPYQQVPQPSPQAPQLSKSSNPFDVNAEASPAQAAQFPSMSSMHAALPNVAASRSIVQPSNMYLPHQQSSYPSAMPPVASSFGSAMPGTYVGQQLPSNMAPPRPQGYGNFGNGGGAYGSLNPPAPTQNSSISGNPFG